MASLLEKLKGGKNRAADEAAKAFQQLAKEVLKRITERKLADAQSCLLFEFESGFLVFDALRADLQLCTGLVEALSSSSLERVSMAMKLTAPAFANRMAHKWDSFVSLMEDRRPGGTFLPLRKAVEVVAGGKTYRGVNAITNNRTGSELSAMDLTTGTLSSDPLVQACTQLAERLKNATETGIESSQMAETIFLLLLESHSGYSGAQPLLPSQLVSAADVLSNAASMHLCVLQLMLGLAFRADAMNPVKLPGNEELFPANPSHVLSSMETVAQKLSTSLKKKPLAAAIIPQRTTDNRLTLPTQRRLRSVSVEPLLAALDFLMADLQKPYLHRLAMLAAPTRTSTRSSSETSNPSELPCRELASCLYQACLVLGVQGDHDGAEVWCSAFVLNRVSNDGSTLLSNEISRATRAGMKELGESDARNFLTRVMADVLYVDASTFIGEANLRRKQGSRDWQPVLRKENRLITSEEFGELSTQEKAAIHRGDSGIEVLVDPETYLDMPLASRVAYASEMCYAVYKSAAETLRTKKVQRTMEFVNGALASAMPSIVEESITALKQMCKGSKYNEKDLRTNKIARCPMIVALSQTVFGMLEHCFYILRVPSSAGKEETNSPRKNYRRDTLFDYESAQGEVRARGPPNWNDPLRFTPTFYSEAIGYLFQAGPEVRAMVKNVENAYLSVNNDVDASFKVFAPVLPRAQHLDKRVDELPRVRKISLETAYQDMAPRLVRALRELQRLAQQETEASSVPLMDTTLWYKRGRDVADRLIEGCMGNADMQVTGAGRGLALVLSLCLYLRVFSDPELAPAIALRVNQGVGLSFTDNYVPENPAVYLYKQVKAVDTAAAGWMGSGLFQDEVLASGLYGHEQSLLQTFYSKETIHMYEQFVRTGRY